MTCTYKKSRKQHEKEMERRRKLRVLVLNVEELYTEVEWAKALGCSQSTVSRDLIKLRGTRWDPIQERLRNIEQKIKDSLEDSRKKACDLVGRLSDREVMLLYFFMEKKRRKRG